MSETDAPREPKHPAPTGGRGASSSTPDTAATPVLWPRDLNTTPATPDWGADPEDLGDA